MHALTVSQELMDFAQIRANEGGRAGGGPHTRPNGDRVGNELATSWVTAQDAFNAWMRSPAHMNAMLGLNGWEQNTRFGVGVGPRGISMIFDRIVIEPA